MSPSLSTFSSVVSMLTGMYVLRLVVNGVVRSLFRINGIRTFRFWIGVLIFVDVCFGFVVVVMGVERDGISVSRDVRDL